MKLHTKALIRLIREVVGIPEIGAEIGVFKADNSEAILSTFPDCKMILVDMWKAWAENEQYYKSNRGMGRLTESQWIQIRQEAYRKTSPYKVSICVMPSRTAADTVEDNSLDFVFLDANHSYESVREDIEIWTPKVRLGGLISGHDYGGPFKGVKRAVDEFFQRENVSLRWARVWGTVKVDETSFRLPG